MVPFIGGFVGGTFDVVTTRGIAAAADALFTRAEEEKLEPPPHADHPAGKPTVVVDAEGVEPTQTEHMTGVSE